MRLAGIAIFLTLALGAREKSFDVAQDKDGARGGIDLRWNLPHDRAAIYDVYDPKTKKRRGEFWLLGCEAQGKLRIGANDTSDLGYRFLFRLPGKKVQVGESWSVRETAFADPDFKRENYDAVDPRWIIGAYRLRKVGRIQPKDFLKSAAGETAIDGALIEGRFQVYRARWQRSTLVMAERRPSAALETLAIIRRSDGAVVGGRRVWRGKIDTWPSVVASSPKTAKGVEGVEILLRPAFLEVTAPGLKARIDKAVKRGRSWLKSQGGREGKIQDRIGGGYPLGSTAMSLLALLHSGISAKDPLINAGFQFLRRSEKKVKDCYETALILMAIEAKYLPVGMLEEARNLSEEKARKTIAEKIERRDREWAEGLARILLQVQGRSGGFGYSDPGERDINLSTTQYAVLGLKSASRMGVKVPGVVWKRTLRYLEGLMVSSGREVKIAVEGRRLTKEGKIEACGWKYWSTAGAAGAEQATGTMTTAALSTIACARSELARLRELDEVLGNRFDRRTWAGLAWLQEKFSVRSGPPEGTCWWAPAWVYYYLYGLERAGILLGVEKLGGHDWYLEGAAALLSWQREDGRWEGPTGPPVLDTAMALLFLKRATIPVETGRPKK